MDASEARARIEALEAELRRERALFARGPVVVFRWVAAADWPVEAAIGNVRALFGCTAEDLVSGRVMYASLVHPDDLARVVAEVAWHTDSGRDAFEQDYRIVRRDGGVRWLYDYTVIVRDRAGAVTHYDGYVFDVSARREAELAVRRKDEELRRAQKMEALGRLAGGIAHDFNNVLTSVLGHADLAAATLPPDAPALEALQRLCRSVGRASALTRQLLAFSRHQILETRVVDLSIVARDALGLVAPVLGEVDPVVTFATEPLWVRVDAGQMEQVVVNLLLNARDAMPSGGKVRVNTSLRSGAEAPEAVGPGAWAVLVVRDDGVGMDASTLARVFEPFFTTKERGTGLGLATAYGVVRQCDGHLIASSAPGRGATFEIWLPRCDPQAEVRAATPARAAERRTGTETLLVVEDHEEVREVTVAALRGRGYQVVAAADGLDALARIDAGLRPDLVVTDLVMPRLDGVGLTAGLTERGLGAPVILVSGYAEGPVPPIPGGPPQAFLAKPFLIETLLDLIARMLDGTAAPDVTSRG